MTKHSLILKKPLAVIDLETTGLNISKDRILEICIAKANVDGSVDVKTRRLKPVNEKGETMKIPLESSMIHGIYDADVENEPSFKQVAASLADFLKGCDIAGFNSNKFDIPLLVEEFIRVNPEMFNIENRNFIDVQRIFHMMEPRTLGAAFKFYCQKDLENAHSAEADTLATLDILQAQIIRYEGQEMKDTKGNISVPIKNDMVTLGELSSKNMVDFAQRMIKNEKGEVLINFGKHNGKRVIDVLKTEPSYYQWIMDGDFPLDTKNKLTKIYMDWKMNISR